MTVHPTEKLLLLGSVQGINIPNHQRPGCRRRLLHESWAPMHDGRSETVEVVDESGLSVRLQTDNERMRMRCFEDRPLVHCCRHTNSCNCLPHTGCVRYGSVYIRVF